MLALKQRRAARPRRKEKLCLEIENEIFRTEGPRNEFSFASRDGYKYTQHVLWGGKGRSSRNSLTFLFRHIVTESAR